MISPLHERRRRAYTRRRNAETSVLYVVFLLFAADAWDFGAAIALAVVAGEVRVSQDEMVQS